MYFHTAGLHFPYKNMHYTMVAGGNAFYVKGGRNWQPLPDEPMVASAAPEMVKPAAPVTMVASAEPVRPAKASRTAPAQQVFMTASVEPARQPKTKIVPAQQTYVTAAAVPTAKSARVTVKQTMVAMQEPMEEPDAARFGGTVNTRIISSVQGEPQEASMGFQSTPENTDAIGAMIVSQGRPLEAN